MKPKLRNTMDLMGSHRALIGQHGSRTIVTRLVSAAMRAPQLRVLFVVFCLNQTVLGEWNRIVIAANRAGVAIVDIVEPNVTSRSALVRVFREIRSQLPPNARVGQVSVFANDAARSVFANLRSSGMSRHGSLRAEYEADMCEISRLETKYGFPLARAIFTPATVQFALKKGQSLDRWSSRQDKNAGRTIGELKIEELWLRPHWRIDYGRVSDEKTRFQLDIFLKGQQAWELSDAEQIHEYFSKMLPDVNISLDIRSDAVFVLHSSFPLTSLSLIGWRDMTFETYAATKELRCIVPLGKRTVKCSEKASTE